MFKPEAQLPQR